MTNNTVTANGMHTLRILLSILTLIVIVACASGPIPERSPKYLRLSTRHLNKGTQYYTKGCFQQALRQFNDAHERYAAAGHLQGTAASLNSLANTYYRLGDAEGALLIYDEAIEIYRSLEDRSGLLRAMTGKAAAHMPLGQLDDAASVLDAADQLAKNDEMLLQRLRTRAILEMHRHDGKTAEKLLKKALNRAPSDAYAQRAGVQYALGHLLLTLQRPAQAITHLNAALQADQEIGAYHGIAQDLAALAACHAQLGNHDQAVFYYKRSLKSYALLGDAAKVTEIRAKLEESARNAGTEVKAVMAWVDQWQAGMREANICR